MGLVFQGEDIQLGRTIALKVMLPEVAAQPGARERFLREARSAAVLDHDNIVAIYHVGEDEGVPYDPRGYTPPDLDAVPERGMGLFLVRQSVDEVAFDIARPRGTRWTLVKYRT